MASEAEAGRRVVLVTAAAGAGIGSAIVRELAGSGWDVIVTDAHEARTVKLAEELSEEHGRGFLGMPLDVTDHLAVAEVVARVQRERGRLDALVNNAGWNKPQPIIEMDPAVWQRCLDVDLTGTFICLRHAAPLIIESGGGAVVNISSIAAWETTVDHGAAYSAAKAAVNALTRVAAAELGPRGVRVNAIAPGFILNPFVADMYAPEFYEGYVERRSLVGRIGDPQDIAALTAFLLSNRAGYITGEVYGVSGGVLPHA